MNEIKLDPEPNKTTEKVAIATSRMNEHLPQRIEGHKISERKVNAITEEIAKEAILAAILDYKMGDRSLRSRDQLINKSRSKNISIYRNRYIKEAIDFIKLLFQGKSPYNEKELRELFEKNSDLSPIL